MPRIILNILRKSLEKKWSHESPNFPTTITFFLQLNRDFAQNTPHPHSASSTLKLTKETAPWTLFSTSIVLLSQYGTKDSSTNSTNSNSLFFSISLTTSKTGPLRSGFPPHFRLVFQFQQEFFKVFLFPPIFTATSLNPQQHILI